MSVPESMDDFEDLIDLLVEVYNDGMYLLLPVVCECCAQAAGQCYTAEEA